MKFFSIKIGDPFYIEGIVCTKTGALSYSKSDELMLGDMQIDPMADNKIETVAEYNARIAPKPTETKAPAKKAAKKPAVNKTAAKKSVAKKAPAKKTAGKKSTTKKAVKKAPAKRKR